MDPPKDLEADSAAGSTAPPPPDPSEHVNASIEIPKLMVNEPHGNHKIVQIEECDIVSDSAEVEDALDDASDADSIFAFDEPCSPHGIILTPRNAVTAQDSTVAALHNMRKHIESMREHMVALEQHRSKDHKEVLEQLKEVNDCLVKCLHSAETNSDQDNTSALAQLKAINKSLDVMEQQLQQQKMGDKLNVLDEKLDALGQQIQDQITTENKRLDLVVADIVDLEQRFKAVEASPLKDSIESLNTNVSKLIETTEEKLSSIETAVEGTQPTQVINENGKRTHVDSVANTADQLHAQFQSSMDEQFSTLLEEIKLQGIVVFDKARDTSNALRDIDDRIKSVGDRLEEVLSNAAKAESDKNALSTSSPAHDHDHDRNPDSAPGKPRKIVTLRLPPSKLSGLSNEKQKDDTASMITMIEKLGDTLGQIQFNLAVDVVPALAVARFSAKSANEDATTRLTDLNKKLDDIIKLIDSKADAFVTAQNHLGDLIGATCQLLEHRLVPFVETVATKDDMKGLTAKMATLEISLQDRNMATKEDMKALTEKMTTLETSLKDISRNQDAHCSAINAAVQYLGAKVSKSADSNEQLATEMREIKRLVEDSNVAAMTADLANDVKDIRATTDQLADQVSLRRVIESLCESVSRMNKRLTIIEAELKSISSTENRLAVAEAGELKSIPGVVEKALGRTEQDLQALLEKRLGHTEQKVQALLEKSIGRMETNVDLVNTRFFKLDGMFRILCGALSFQKSTIFFICVYLFCLVYPVYCFWRTSVNQ